MNTSINYDAGYDWRSSSLAAEDFGNTIQNNNSIRVNTQFNLTSLYNKVPLLKKLLSTQNSQSRSRMNSRVDVSDNQNNNNKSTNKILKSIVKSVFSLKMYLFLHGNQWYFVAWIFA